MRILRELIAIRETLAGTVALLAALSVYPIQAQTEGNNVVYNSSGTCCSGSSNASYAFVDASVFDNANGNKGDVCADILSAYGAYSGAKMVVIDARGIAPGSSGICSSSPFPSMAVPAVILLPAGKIPLGTNWVLPDRTRIVGEGADPTKASGTILQATTSSSFMIEFGSSAVCVNNICDGIGVENLTLDGNGVSVGGIRNKSSQERSYVNDVSLVNISGTGLDVETSNGSGQDSGPYSNITFIAGSTSAVCANIFGYGATHGIHGIKCTGTGLNDPVGIYLASNGNSLEDVYVDGFADGIRIVSGSQTVQGNVVVNVTGGTDVTNVVHICGTLGVDCGSTNIGDLTILQVSKNGAQNAILDELTPTYSGSTGQPTLVTDNSVAIYAIGDPNSSGYGGTSRFTTATQSVNVPAWMVGNGPASGSCTNKNGTLYSNNGSGSTLYVCVAGAWNVVK